MLLSYKMQKKILILTFSFANSNVVKLQNTQKKTLILIFSFTNFTT